MEMHGSVCTCFCFSVGELEKSRDSNGSAEEVARVPCPVNREARTGNDECSNLTPVDSHSSPYLDKYVCRKCKKVQFIDRLDDRPTCGHCGRSYASRFALDNHVRTVHIGDTSHSTSAIRAELSTNRHRQRRADQTSICPVCGKTMTSASLYSHMNCHVVPDQKDRTCDHCGKSFKSRSYLKEHVRIHTGETPYTCQECGKSFTHHVYLQRHLKVHTQLRPYQCQLCSKNYKRYEHLWNHAKKFHNIKPCTSNVGCL
jgi:uncharacterized Zn-finger protein